MAVTNINRRWRSERGAELIELAMVTPILLLIIGGIIDFGFLFRSWEVVTNAAREGARVGVLPSYSCEAAAPADIQSRVDAYMGAAGITDADSYTVEMATMDIPTAVGTFKACAVEVTLTQPMPALSVFGHFFGNGFADVPVASAAVMRTEEQVAAPAP